MNAAGHVDLISPDLIEGWLYLPAAAKPAVIEVFLGPLRIGSCRADRPRQDLAAAGYGDGCCAFSFVVPLHQAVKNPDSLRLRLSGTPLHLLHDAQTRLSGLETPAQHFREVRSVADTSQTIRQRTVPHAKSVSGSAEVA